MGSAGSQVPINGKNPPKRGSAHTSQQDPSTRMWKIVLNKVLFVLLMNCQASGRACSPGLDLWWKLNNATALRVGHVPSQRGSIPKMRIGHSALALVKEQGI